MGQVLADKLIGQANSIIGTPLLSSGLVIHVNGSEILPSQQMTMSPLPPNSNL